MPEPARPPDISAEDWAATPAAVRTLVQDQQRRLEEQDARLTTLEARLAALEERLKQTSRTSSRPPSSDPPSAPGGFGPRTQATVAYLAGRLAGHQPAGRSRVAPGALPSGHQPGQRRRPGTAGQRGRGSACRRGGGSCPAAACGQCG